MNPVNLKARNVLNHLGEAATAAGGSVKIDNTGGLFMPVCVEHIGNNCLSVAHYGEQNGDAMRDPDMVFWFDGINWYPVSFRNDFLGVDNEAVTEWENNRPKMYCARLQSDQARFAEMWMNNITQQQNLEIKPAAVPV